MPQYIKSHSNYVLKKKHQDVADGTIWERDITTIGGVNNFSPGQIPIYKTNNFIITVRDDGKTANQHNRSKWVQNGTSGDVWTMSVVENETSGDDDQNDLKIVLKQDYYDFCDFAYYGSLNEMFRASINDIFRRFPGELYCTDEEVYYDISSSSSSTLGSDGFECLVSNPFNINIHSVKKPIDGEELKFFANDGYKNYTIGRDGGEPVTSWTSTYYYSEYNKETKKYDWYSASTDDTPHRYSANTYPYPCKPNDKLADITINNTQIKAYIGGNNDVVYLTTSGNNGTYIRPSEKFLVKFYNECDNFEKLILNPKTTPKYKSTFSVIKEGERGYYRELEEFVFPTTYGGYNVDASAYGFNTFTKRLSDIGLFYDEYFTDNLWRTMTHEAIKNFDWTYTREFYQGDDDEYIHGGEKMQKALRVFAREFDEILSYIEAVKNSNRITYDERSNVPDYFLLDKLEERGWDVKMTYPYVYSEEDKKYSQKLSGSVKPYTKEKLKYKEGYFVLPCGSGDIACYYENSRHGYAYIGASGEITSSYTKTNGETIILNRNKAYSSEREYTYVDANNEFMRRMVINSPYIFRHKGTIEGIEMTLGMFGLKSKRWCDAHNAVDPCNEVTYDYDVTEYTRFAERIEEKWDAVHQMYRFDWINSTKTIVYDYRSTSNYTKYGAPTDYVSYQGLPVAYRDEEIISGKCSGSGDTYICESAITSGCTCVIETGDTGNTCIVNCPFIKVSPLYSNPRSAQCVTCDVEEAFKRIDEDNAPVLRRYLYPNFNKYEQIDGNPYFQMNGGWLSKKKGDKYIQFDVDDNLVESDEPIYKETVRNIKRVNTLTDLLSTPIGTVKDGTIYYVSNIGNDLAAIDDAIYEVKYEYCGECEDGTNSETPPIKRYISLIKGQEYIKVGSDKFFDTTIMVYDENGEMATYSLIDKDEGYEVKAYIKDNPSEGEREFICQADSEGTYTIESFVLINKDEEDMTNYFIINDAYYSNRLAYKIKLEDEGFVWSDGWRRLRNDDTDYLKANTITNYFEGNNPHNGNMVYDGGKEYYTYFERLFKHAIDNELFDERCYESFYNDLDEEISKIGFNSITLIENDPKIHYFGEYYDRSGSAQTSSLSNGLLCGFSGYPKYDYKDDTTNQIMNDKALKITFYFKKNNDLSELKYIDDIVLNYLTQVIPSTSIVEIEYIINKENN